MKFGFPGGSSGKESACNAGDSVSILVRKIPWRRDSPPTPVFLGFPGGSDSKESACNEEDLGSIPGLGKSPGGRHDNPLQYSWLENPHGQRSLASLARPSIRSQRVGHDWATKHRTFCLLHNAWELVLLQNLVWRHLKISDVTTAHLMIVCLSIEASP